MNESTARNAVPAVGLAEGWVLRLNLHGTKLWDRFYGSSRDDLLGAITATDDGGFVRGGMSAQIAWLLRIDSVGEKLWEGTFGAPPLGRPVSPGIAHQGAGFEAAVG